MALLKMYWYEGVIWHIIPDGKTFLASSHQLTRPRISLTRRFLSFVIDATDFDENH